MSVVKSRNESTNHSMHPPLSDAKVGYLVDLFREGSLKASFNLLIRTLNYNTCIGCSEFILNMYVPRKSFIEFRNGADGDSIIGSNTTADTEERIVVSNDLQRIVLSNAIVDRINTSLTAVGVSPGENKRNEGSLAKGQQVFRSLTKLEKAHRSSVVHGR
jgi:hypothetical protein